MKKTFYLTLITLVFFACSNHGKEEFQIAKQLNTLESYQAFVRDFPKGAYSDSALIKIQEIKFNGLKFIGKTEAYENFLIDYPSGMYADSAKNQIFSIEFKKAKKSFSVKKLENFIAKYPNNPYKTQADSLIKDLKYALTDKGIKENVIKAVRAAAGSDKCALKAPLEVFVKDGYVTIKYNCVKFAKCKSRSRMDFFSWHSGAIDWLNNEVEPRVKKVPGVKSVNTIDSGN